jgi:hypothetical protein
MRDVSQKVVKRIKTHFTFNNSFSSENLMYVGEKIRARRDQMPIRCMDISCWTITATDTHTVFVILIAFQRQQRISRRRLNVTYCVCQFINKGSVSPITSCEMRTKISVGKSEEKNCLGDTGIHKRV